MREVIGVFQDYYIENQTEVYLLWEDLVVVCLVVVKTTRAKVMFPLTSYSNLYLLMTCNDYYFNDKNPKVAMGLPPQAYWDLKYVKGMHV